MAVTITYTGATPTVDADEDVWGDELNNDALAPIKTDLDALASQGNASEALASGALSRAGGTMTGDAVLANAAPSDVRSAGFRGTPVVSIDTDRTFVATDAGQTVRLFGATPRTWTIPPVGSVGFPVGTVIVLRSFATATLTIARGSGVTLRLAGSSADGNKSLTSFGLATLVMEDNNIWVLSGVGVA